MGVQKFSYDVGALFQDFQSGMFLKDMAKKHRVSYECVRGVQRKYGWRRKVRRLDVSEMYRRIGREQSGFKNPMYGRRILDLPKGTLKFIMKRNSLKEACKLLGVSSETLRRLLWEKNIWYSKSRNIPTGAISALIRGVPIEVVSRDLRVSVESLVRKCQYLKVEYVRLFSRAAEDEIKKIVKERDSVCTQCGSEELLAVHHLEEDKFCTAEENMILVCNPCHRKIHNKTKEVRLH